MDFAGGRINDLSLIAYIVIRPHGIYRIAHIALEILNHHGRVGKVCQGHGQLILDILVSDEIRRNRAAGDGCARLRGGEGKTGYRSESLIAQRKGDIAVLECNLVEAVRGISRELKLLRVAV